MSNSKLDEAQNIALSFDEPYRTRMLGQAWKKSYGSKWSDYSLFLWLEKLTPEMRENIAPGKYKMHGIRIVRNSIPHSYDWRVAEKIGYELSVSELKQLAKNGNQWAIDILNKA